MNALTVLIILNIGLMVQGEAATSKVFNKKWVITGVGSVQFSTLQYFLFYFDIYVLFPVFFNVTHAQLFASPSWQWRTPLIIQKTGEIGGGVAPIDL